MSYTDQDEAVERRNNYYREKYGISYGNYGAIIERLEAERDALAAMLEDAGGLHSEVRSERDALRRVCEAAEQTLRNLAMAFIVGDCAEIAKNEAANLRTALDKPEEEQI